MNLELLFKFAEDINFFFANGFPFCAYGEWEIKNVPLLEPQFNASATTRTSIMGTYESEESEVVRIKTLKTFSMQNFHRCPLLKFQCCITYEMKMFGITSFWCNLPHLLNYVCFMSFGKEHFCRLLKKTPKFIFKQKLASNFWSHQILVSYFESSKNCKHYW